MIEDPELIEFTLKPINQKNVAFSEKDEIAYSLQSISHGRFSFFKEAEEKLRKIIAASSTLGFEIDSECDFEPFYIKTYNADGSENAHYQYGDTGSGKDNFQKECRFKPGDKVLCLMFEGYDAVFPGIVVGPVTEEYLRNLYNTDEDMQIGYSSADEAVEQWTDWNRDSVIIRPLVSLKNEWGEMGDTVMVNRIYVFPYKKFQI